MKKALITGIRGQDSAWLSKILLEKNYIVIGTDRRSGGSDNWRLKQLGIDNHPNLIYEYMDITEPHNVDTLIKKYQPDEIYQLAAQSFVQISFDQPYVTNNVNYYGHLNVLESVKHYSPESKVYFAATSEMYGKVQEIPQKESTPFYPRSPYGVSKLASYYLGINYREAYNLFICNGILFNHCGKLRGDEFITQKVVKNVCSIFFGEKVFFEIGNLDAKRDWGHALDYCKAMHLMLQQDKPDDYVIATGKTYSIREFIEKCFNYADIPIYWKNSGLDEVAIDEITGNVVVRINPKFFRPSEVDLLIGDSTKAKSKLGWEPEYNIDSIIKEMMDNELKKGI